MIVRWLAQREVGGFPVHLAALAGRDLSVTQIGAGRWSGLVRRDVRDVAERFAATARKLARGVRVGARLMAFFGLAAHQRASTGSCDGFANAQREAECRPEAHRVSPIRSLMEITLPCCVADRQTCHSPPTPLDAKDAMPLTGLPWPSSP